jgi:hypothetical protein
MSSQSRSTRNQRSSNTPQSSQSRIVPPVIIPARPPVPDVAFFAQRDRLLEEYHRAYDQGYLVHRRLVEEEDADALNRLLGGMALALDNVEDVVIRMEKLPAGDWPFSRPAIGFWRESISLFERTDDIDEMAARILDLSTRLRRISGASVEVPSLAPPTEVAEDEDPVIVHETKVSIPLLPSIIADPVHSATDVEVALRTSYALPSPPKNLDRGAFRVVRPNAVVRSSRNIGSRKPRR